MKPQDLPPCFPSQLESLCLPSIYRVLYFHHLICSSQLAFAKCRRWDGILFVIDEETDSLLEFLWVIPNVCFGNKLFLFFSFLEDHKQNGQDKDSSITRL